jgi:hypothetical protein
MGAEAVLIPKLFEELFRGSYRNKKWTPVSITKPR